MHSYSFCQYGNLINKPYAERASFLIKFYLDTLRDKKIDSSTVFAKINAISIMAKNNNDEDLLLETQLMRIHYFFYRDNFDKSIILSMLDSLRIKAETKNKTWLLARIESLAALTCFVTGYNYELSFIHFERMHNLISKMTKEEFPDKQACYYQMANSYYFFADIPNTIKYLRAGLAETPTIKEYKFLEQSANTLGLCYQKLNKFDSSNYYFQKAYEYAATESNNRREWEGITSGNIGYNYYLQKQYDKAKPLLQKDVDIAIEYKDWGLAVGSLVPLAAISIQEKDLGKAEKYLVLARQFAEQSGSYSRYEKVYIELSRLETARGNGKLATTYLDSVLVVKDSLARKFNALQMLRAQQKVAIVELSRVNSEKRINIIERNILILGIVLLMVIAVWLYMHQTQKVHLKEEALQKAKEELEDATKELHLFTRKIADNNAIIETLQEQLGATNTTAIIQLQQSTILTDDEWDAFRKLFEKVHIGYLQRLKEKQPELSPAEIRFMVLSKLNLSNKEMAAILGVGTDAIRQTRSRLRKKLNLTEDGNLDELVGAI